MERVQLASNLEISRIIHGHWRLIQWKLSPQELLKLVKSVYELGITTFDHADIYGNYECEEQMGKALALDKSFRDKIEIISKCGIKLKSDKYPNREIGTYDYSSQHIIKSVEQSLTNLHTDRLDLLLLHRPSPLFNPHEVAEAFNKLLKEGKVLNFGVSNFTPDQIMLLESVWEGGIVTNQVEISPNNLTTFQDSTINYLQSKNITPMAWSPLAGGELLKPSNEKSNRIYSVLTEISKEIDEPYIDKIIYAWILKHPSKIAPVIGSEKIERVKNAVDSLQLNLTDEQWFRIYIASTGENLP